MNLDRPILRALDKLADEADYAVIGPTDGRKRVTNTRATPYSAICHIERDFGDGRLSGCTAFLVGPRTLLTAGHCLLRPLRRRLGLPATPRRIRVTPGRGAARDAPFGSQWAASWRVHPDYNRRPNQQVDIGVIRLRRPFPGLSPLRLRIADAPLVDLVRRRRLVHISGYPADKPEGTQWEHSERLDRATPQQLFYSVDTCPGHSGSPIWVHLRPGGPAVVIGVHTAGPRPHAEGPWGCRAGVPLAPKGMFNRGVRLTRELLTVLDVQPTEATGKVTLSPQG